MKKWTIELELEGGDTVKFRNIKSGSHQEAYGKAVAMVGNRKVKKSKRW